MDTLLGKLFAGVGIGGDPDYLSDLEDRLIAAHAAAIGAMFDGKPAVTIVVRDLDNPKRFYISTHDDLNGVIAGIEGVLSSMGTLRFAASSSAPDGDHTSLTEALQACIEFIDETKKTIGIPQGCDVELTGDGSISMDDARDALAAALIMPADVMEDLDIAISNAIMELPEGLCDSDLYDAMRGHLDDHGLIVIRA